MGFHQICHVSPPFFYNWILLATEEEWLTQDDLYDLNFAFVYAAALWGHEFSYETFDATLEEQYDQFEETMVTATREIMEEWKRNPQIPDMRTAAYVVAINKVGTSYAELGIFP